MLPVRTKYVPWFSPQLSCSQRDEPLPEHTMAPTEPPPRSKRDRRGKKRGNVKGEKTRGVLKVKLPKFSKDVTKQDKTPRKWMTEPAAKTTVKRRGEGAQRNVAKTGAGTDTGSVGGNKINEKEKAKLAVLRTISKVLEENQLIRQRLAALSQAN